MNRAGEAVGSPVRAAAWLRVKGEYATYRLVVRGELSPILPADMAARLGASIPRAEVVEIKGAYHHLTLDAPDAFARVLERFLRSVI